MKQISSRTLLIGLSLVALMAATRMHHFGSPLHLPDASLAVFLLAGFFIASPLFFAGLLVEAGALDYVAITHLGVSDYCVTPAYWFLIPTYAVLWYAGRFLARSHQYSLRRLGMFAGISFVAVSAAFVISNGAFYLFSGRFPELSIAEYTGRMAQYYLPYLTGAVVYLVPAALLYALTSRPAGAAESAAH
ncbi:MAG: hypothetical protein M0P59_14355 [Gallionella sp.]|jgi:hypothetical protein|nr:hypothetical protein [Gallionella sp.]MCK9355313.1 hypothetical protein [Gallionella sp.]